MLIEVWLTTEESQYDPRYVPYNAFHDWFQTDEAGHYEATTPKPGHYGIISLNYHVNAQDHCPLIVQLVFIDDPGLRDTVWRSGRPIKLGLEQRESAGSIVRGPIDIVMPVPTSGP